MSENTWHFEYGSYKMDHIRSNEDDIVDVIAENASSDDETELKQYKSGILKQPMDFSTKTSNVPQSSMNERIDFNSSRESKMSPINRHVSEFSMSSFKNLKGFDHLGSFSSNYAKDFPPPDDKYEETELTKELKTKVKAMEKRNLDLIIEVEQLKLELDKQRKFADNQRESILMKARENEDEIEDLRKHNAELQNNHDEINKKLMNTVSKLDNAESSYKSLKEECKILANERDKLASELEAQKNEHMNAVRNCRLKEQHISYNELNLCRIESENEIMKEKLKFSENTTKELIMKTEALKSELEQCKNAHKEEAEKMRRKIGHFKSDMESVRIAHNGLTLKHAVTVKKLNSLEEKNINLQNKVDVLLEAEKKLLHQMDEIKLRGKASKDELVNVRKELFSVRNRLNKKEEEVKMMENQLRKEALMNEKIKEECDKFEKIAAEQRTENLSLLKEKENSEIRMITSANSSECLKKDNLHLIEEIRNLKNMEKELRQELLKHEKAEVSREAKLVNVEALNEILCSIYRNTHKGRNTSDLPDFWSKKETEWAMKSDVIGKLSELEINKAENESRISSLLNMLSNYRDAFHTMYASLEKRVTPPFEYLKMPINPPPILKRNNIFQRFTEFENLHRNVKITYEEKCALLHRQEGLLKKEVEQLETALLASRKNEVKLRHQLDAQTNNLNTPQKPPSSLKSIKLCESILELEAQERRLKRRVTELLLVEEYLVKNTNALKSFSTETPASEYFKRLPPERDLPHIPKRGLHGLGDEEWVRPSRHPLDWIDLHATMKNDLYQEAIMFEKTKHLKNKEISLIKKLSSTEEECRKYQDKIVEDQHTIHKLNLQCRQLEISESSLKQQLELVEEREKKLAKKVCDLTENLTSLETSLRSSKAHEETLTVELSNFRAREDEWHLQLTHAYDELNDKIVEETSYKKKIKDVEDQVNRLESEVNTSKLVEDQLKSSLEASKDNEAIVKNKLTIKKHKLKLLKADYKAKAEDYLKIKQSEFTLKEELGVRIEELRIANEKIKSLEKKNSDINTQYDSLLKILEHHKQEFHSKLEEKKHELDSLHKSSFDMKRDLIEKEKENEILKQNICEMRISNVQLKDSLDDFENKVSDAYLKISELEINLGTSLKHENQLNDELKATKECLKSSESEGESLREELLMGKKRIHQLERENENLRIDLKVMKEENISLGENIENLNFKSKKREAEVSKAEDQFREDLLKASTKEDELKRKVAELESITQIKAVETLKNLSYNSKEVQVDFSLQSIIPRLSSEDALYLVESHNDFKRAANLLSMKYPQMYKDFMSDMKALVVGGKRWAEEKRFLDTKTNDDLVQESFFDLSPQKVKSNPLYGKGLDLDQCNDTDAEDVTTDPDLSESGQSTAPVTPQPIKTFPLQFAPAFQHSKQIGQAFHKFWPMPINEIKQDLQSLQNSKEDPKLKKKVTYQEEKTTYVRSRHLSTPAAPLFKTSYVDNQPKIEDPPKELLKPLFKTPPWKTTSFEPRKQLFVLKESSVDGTGDVDVKYQTVSNDAEAQDIFEENIVQKRIALFENKVTR